ncbi:hypothetical protein V5799_020541, partial [Amblyomma americanum]
MDDDGLPIIGPGVDYTKSGFFVLKYCHCGVADLVPPIQQKRTLAFLNYFLTRTTSFLNHFATVCDEKLEDLLIRIQRLEASMCILEAKLSSIPGLENVTADAAASAKPEAGGGDGQGISGAAQATAGHSQPQANGPTTDSKEVSKAADGPAPAAQPAAAPTNTVSKDPRFSKYFKMLSV